MRDQWYADNKDLVKWSVLLTLAQRFSAKHILQILYFRPTEWAQVDLDDERFPLPEAVIRHFRHAAAASSMEATAPIGVLADPFIDRNEYHRLVIERIRNRPAAPGIVFLDPDTGLESGTPSFKHVLSRELGDLWAELRPGDFLAFYQHQTNRNGQPWIAPKKAQFEHAIGLPIGAAKVGRSEAIARDVALFYAQTQRSR